jgi:hypothetical protein
MSSKRFHSLKFSNPNGVCISRLSHSCNILRPHDPSQVHHPNSNISWGYKPCSFSLWNRYRRYVCCDVHSYMLPKHFNPPVDLTQDNVQNLSSLPA